MAATLKGKGIVWGTTGITGGAAESAVDKWGSATTAYVTDCDGGVEADTAPIEDEIGEVQGMVFYNKRLTYTITCVPVSTTVALAGTAAAALTDLAPGSKVTIADPDGTTFDGAYVVNSVRKRKTNKGATVVEMSITKYVNDITATVT